MIDDVLAWLPGFLSTMVWLVAMPLNWYVTVLLLRIARDDPGGEAIHVVAVLSTCVALIVTVFAIVFVNNDFRPPVLTLTETQILTRGSLLVLSVVPALYWLRWYRRRNGR